MLLDLLFTRSPKWLLLMKMAEETKHTGPGLNLGLWLLRGTWWVLLAAEMSPRRIQAAHVDRQINRWENCFSGIRFMALMLCCDVFFLLFFHFRVFDHIC